MGCTKQPRQGNQGILHNRFGLISWQMKSRSGHNFAAAQHRVLMASMALPGERGRKISSQQLQKMLWLQWRITLTKTAGNKSRHFDSHSANEDNVANIFFR